MTAKTTQTATAVTATILEIPWRPTAMRVGQAAKQVARMVIVADPAATDMDKLGAVREGAASATAAGVREGTAARPAVGVETAGLELGTETVVTAAMDGMAAGAVVMVPEADMVVEVGMALDLMVGADAVEMEDCLVVLAATAVRAQAPDMAETEDQAARAAAASPVATGAMVEAAATLRETAGMAVTAVQGSMVQMAVTAVVVVTRRAAPLATEELEELVAKGRRIPSVRADPAGTVEEAVTAAAGIAAQGAMEVQVEMVVPEVADIRKDRVETAAMVVTAVPAGHPEMAEAAEAAEQVTQVGTVAQAVLPEVGRIVHHPWKSCPKSRLARGHPK